VSGSRVADDPGTVVRVYELRARVAGRVDQVEVDEGQLVAEDDVIAIVDRGGDRVDVLTDVPGVVRELYLERGAQVLEGEIVALIDES
jgi:multidrug efflux pump subunit AcrA (membrane-fusion protein)